MRDVILKILVLSFVVCSLTGYSQTGNLTEEQRLSFDKIYFRALSEKMQENYRDAELSFKEALLLDTANANVYYQLAEIIYYQKRPKDALRYAIMAVNLNNKNIWYNNLLAELYKASKNYEKCASLYLSMYKNIKPEINYLFEAATCYFYTNQFSKSIDVLNQIEKITGPNEEVIIKKEQVYLQNNKINKAIKEVERLLKLYPDIKYKGMLADLYLSKKDTKKALAIYNSILDEDSLNGYANMALSEHYKELNNKNLENFHLKRAVSSSDLEAKYKIEVILTLLNPQNKEFNKPLAIELIEIFKQSNKGEPSAHMLQADLYLQEKNYKEARIEYREASKLDTRNYQIWQQILYCGQELNDNEGILMDCENALSYFPAEPIFYHFKAITSLQQKLYQPALESALKGIEFILDNDELKVQMYSIAGDAAHYAKLPHIVDSVYELALAVEPKNAYALNNYAYFLSLRKVKLDKADSMSLLSLEIEPNSSSYLDTYGWILFQKKEYKKAKEYIEKSLKITPNSGEVLEHYGDILYHLNEKESALNYWIKAKENNATGEFLDEKIKLKKFID